MKRLISIAVVLAMTAARPETYKETEDFQYSRSSSDDGTKSGFYGAQRGNMGGNYERAHNMDGLAQHQMSGAVKQVEGELGDAINTKTGSVFTSANSRGMYGSGHYDLSNLQGRNFQEGVHSYEDSQSHASISSHSQHGNYAHQSASSLQSSGLKGDNQRFRYNGYRGLNDYGRSIQSGNLQAEQTAQEGNYGQAMTHSSGYHSQSGYESQSAYDSSIANQHSSHNGYIALPQNRLIVATPVRIRGRPGQRVAIPLGVQTYDATHSGSTLDQNAIDMSEAEVFNNADSVTFRPNNNAKRYDSSYSYRKQWEKHDVKPEIIAVQSVPTENPISKTSELYDDTQASNSNYHAGFNSHSGYSNTHLSDSHVKSLTAAQQQYQYGSSSLHSNVASGLNSDTNTHGTYRSRNSADMINAFDASDNKPKSYQSSYAYHKSWQRQGDPYEIKPEDGSYSGQASQRLSAASSDHSSYICCVENKHERVARSYDVNQESVNNLRGQWVPSQTSDKLMQGPTKHKQDIQLNSLNQYQQKQNLENLDNLLDQPTEQKRWTRSQTRYKQIFTRFDDNPKKWYDLIHSKKEFQQNFHFHDKNVNTPTKYVRNRSEKNSEHLDGQSQRNSYTTWEDYDLLDPQNTWTGVYNDKSSDRKKSNLNNKSQNTNNNVQNIDNNKLYQKPESRNHAKIDLEQSVSNKWILENTVGASLRQLNSHDKDCKLKSRLQSSKKRRPTWMAFIREVPLHTPSNRYYAQALLSRLVDTEIGTIYDQKPENDLNPPDQSDINPKHREVSINFWKNNSNHVSNDQEVYQHKFILLKDTDDKYAPNKYTLDEDYHSEHLDSKRDRPPIKFEINEPSINYSYKYSERDNDMNKVKYKVTTFKYKKNYTRYNRYK